jgi:GntR family transcriptional repressor for pyruvate dehydrogenase complex
LAIGGAGLKRRGVVNARGQLGTLSVVGEREKRPLVNGSLVALLREEILARGDGENLGREGELLDRLRVGRSTLRQAARILEQEQLLTVRRGVQGGYFTRRPDESAVARSAALYLRLKQATRADLLQTSRLLSVEAARLAALSEDQSRRDYLRVQLEILQKSARYPMSVQEFWRRSQIFTRAMFELAGNPFLELFVGITYIFGGGVADAPPLSDQPDRMERWESIQWRLGEALINREADVAAALAGMMADLMAAWMAEGADRGLLESSLQTQVRPGA